MAKLAYADDLAPFEMHFMYRIKALYRGIGDSRLGCCNGCCRDSRMPKSRS